MILGRRPMDQAARCLADPIREPEKNHQTRALCTEEFVHSFESVHGRSGRNV